MGWVAIAYMALTVAVAAYSYFALGKAQAQNRTDMKPTGLEAFSVTRCEEGSVVPLTYGTNRLPGNILWYGNLITKPITETVSGGGKGGGGGDEQDIVVGYRYYMDVWFSLCEGPVTIEKTFINGKQATPDVEQTIFNDGTETSYPTEPGVNASKLKGVAHVFYKGWNLGDNVSFVPTVHFVVKKNLNTGVTNENMSSGNNPSAICYDLLKKAGETEGNLNKASFNTAAVYWNTRGYGINTVFSSQDEAGEMIQKILNWVDGMLYMDMDGTHHIKAFDPAEASIKTLTEDDFLEFSFVRPTYEDLPNDFRATFMEEASDFSDRVVKCPNQANQRLIGRKIPLSLDLKCFKNLSTASKRLFEIMKRESYPAAKVEFSTTLKHSDLKKGDIITIYHEDYGIVLMSVRIIHVSHQQFDKNEMDFQAIQVVETLFDDEFQTSGGTSWAEPDWAPIPFTKQAVFELPFNPLTQDNEAYLLLASREKKTESAFNVYFSTTVSDYILTQKVTTFAQYGTLDILYPNTTKKIDDEAGITFTAYLDDPVFDSISRTDLFGKYRYALIDSSEVVQFQTITALGGNQFKLTGVIRGVFHTTIGNHTVGKTIWLFNIKDNIFYGRGSGLFNLKYVPSGVAISAVTALNVTSADKAKKPWPVGRILTVRSGTNVTVTLWPNSQKETGAGHRSPDLQTDQWPPAYTGDFEAQINTGTPWHESSYTFIYSQAGQHTLKIKHRINGFLSDVKQLTVGASDGDYYG